MNFLDIRAGDNVEVDIQVAFRFWRYVFPPFEAPIRLLSWVPSKRWHPVNSWRGHRQMWASRASMAIKPWMTWYGPFVANPNVSWVGGQMTECDGVVIGTVALWGVIWEHAKGYRAQFARPTSFISSYGKRSEEALAELRASFLK